MKITINSKDLHLTFGLHMAEMLLHAIAGKQKVGAIQFISNVIAYAHENYCLGHDMEPLMTKGEIFQYLEANSNDTKLAEVLQQVIAAYQESQPAQAIAGQTAAKKKRTTAK